METRIQNKRGSNGMNRKILDIVWKVEQTTESTHREITKEEKTIRTLKQREEWKIPMLNV